MDLEAAQRKIFIGGLSYGTDDEKLRKYFEAYGRVQDAVVMKDPISRRSRGFGFITFDSVSSVDNALAQDIHTIDSRRVEAKRAVPRSEVSRDTPSPKQSQSSPQMDPRSSDDVSFNKIFVGGLHYDTRDEDFRGYFERFGKVVSAEVMFNRDTHKSRGFGFIVFESESGVDAVCVQKEHIIDGKSVEVKRAVPRSRIGSSPSLGSHSPSSGPLRTPQSGSGIASNRQPSDSNISDSSSLRSTPTSALSPSYHNASRDMPSPLHLSSPIGSLSPLSSASSHGRKLPPAPPTISRGTSAASYAAALRFGPKGAPPLSYGRPNRSQSDPLQLLAAANKHISMLGLNAYQQQQQQQQHQQQRLQRQLQQQTSPDALMPLYAQLPQPQNTGQHQQQRQGQQQDAKSPIYNHGPLHYSPGRSQDPDQGRLNDDNGGIGFGVRHGTPQSGWSSLATGDDESEQDDVTSMGSLLSSSTAQWLPSSLSPALQPMASLSSVRPSSLNIPPAMGLSVLQEQNSMTSNFGSHDWGGSQFLGDSTFERSVYSDSLVSSDHLGYSANSPIMATAHSNEMYQHNLEQQQQIQQMQQMQFRQHQQMEMASTIQSLMDGSAGTATSPLIPPLSSWTSMASLGQHQLPSSYSRDVQQLYCQPPIMPQQQQQQQPHPHHAMQSHDQQFHQQLHLPMMNQQQMNQLHVNQQMNQQHISQQQLNPYLMASSPQYPSVSHEYMQYNLQQHNQTQSQQSLSLELLLPKPTNLFMADHSELRYTPNSDESEDLDDAFLMNEMHLAIIATPEPT